VCEFLILKHVINKKEVEPTYRWNSDFLVFSNSLE